MQVPWALGATLLAYNVRGAPARLKLSGPVLADIYLGKITHWNDPAIARLNPGSKLPATAITPVYHSDGSGDTYGFTDYLSKVSPEWKSKHGVSTQINFPTGTGGKGNDGVAAQLGRTDGAIGYLGISYVFANHLDYALVRNASGKFPIPGVPSILAAARTVSSLGADNAVSITNPPASAPDAYPISTFTYAIVPKGSAKASLLKPFLTYAVTTGQQFAQSLQFAPLAGEASSRPTNRRSRVSASRPASTPARNQTEAHGQGPAGQRTASAMRVAVVAHRASQTNVSLAARTWGGLPVELLSPREALLALKPGDVALARLDVREDLVGAEEGLTTLERLADSGVTVLNPPAALLRAHDKLLTARTLRRAGLPHPRTKLVERHADLPDLDFPVVVKPRFGSWGRDVCLCKGRRELERTLGRLSARSWFRSGGAITQELIPPLGHDLRVIVARGEVVGAAVRTARAGRVAHERRARRDRLVRRAVAGRREAGQGRSGRVGARPRRHRPPADRARWFLRARAERRRRCPAALRAARPRYLRRCAQRPRGRARAGGCSRQRGSRRGLSPVTSS